ncbi:MAG TPA: hypothetical protein ENJ22_01820 [Gammaproteobacteria bacterium]|nr:hypothetical protein [Gammaproteobacteria bacterium]
MAIENCCVAVFDQLRGARAAVRAFDGDDGGLSVVGCARNPGMGACCCGEGRLRFVGDGADCWHVLQARFPATALITMPPLGMVMAVGALAERFAQATRTGGGAGGGTLLGEALYRLSVPRESITRYEAALRAARCLVVIEGSEACVADAHDQMARGRPTDLAIHLG